MIKIISEVLRSDYEKVLTRLVSPEVYISQEDINYQLLRLVISTSHNNLSSNQEETDTKLILYVITQYMHHLHHW